MAKKRRHRLACLYEAHGDGGPVLWWGSHLTHAKWRDGEWWEGNERVSDIAGYCPGPKGQKHLRAVVRKRGVRGVKSLTMRQARDNFSVAFQLDRLAKDKLGSFAPGKQRWVPGAHPMPAVDPFEEERPPPRPGQKLCECGLPAAPGLDMCRRCAMLDYGSDNPTVMHGRRAEKRQALIAAMRDRPEGATITELLYDMGGDPSSRRDRNTMEAFLLRSQGAGRIIKRPCVRHKEQAVCWHLDTAFARRGPRPRRHR
jgi:hypothetical protein